MDRLIEIFRRLILAVIWISGGGVALLFLTLGFTQSDFSIFLAISFSLGFLMLSYFCNLLLNWIFVKKSHSQND